MRTILGCLAFVAGTVAAQAIGVLDADPAAYMNGAAAIISAVALLREKSQMREDLQVLNQRVAVLESKAS